MSNEIMVSVICNAYNHEKYIRDALEGFVMQKTSFKYEILVHDDASTDGTADIIREYERKYPDIIKPIYQTENQYSKQIKISMVYQYPRAQGKYIAFCEGDDYWTDPFKLQKQYDAMEKHPELDICAHAVLRVKANTKEIIGNISPAQCDTILTPQQVIAGGGGYVATNSLFYRSIINKKVPESRRAFPFDYSLQISGSLRGGMLYLNDCMSVYRIGVHGSWTSTMKDILLEYNHLKRLDNYFTLLNNETNGTYKKIIKKKIIEMWYKFYYRITNINEEPYCLTFEKLPLLLRIRIVTKRYLKRKYLLISKKCSLFKKETKEKMKNNG